ncbi:MAG: prenyltransferase [candidate division KSB1 bacterium]|jgi:1,4-dihydroxy-2-naphthoate octaprenyltransferase|nr:prenyltransferase [candidate division KSB1 bacterium]
MNTNKPGLMRMIRAPFLSSIISPLIIGTLLGAYINGSLDILNFILVFVMGICLHIATNVYNDIYDTLQGTDKINVNRNEFSGGSGVLIDYPDLLPSMQRIARIALIGALITTLLLMTRLETNLKIVLALLYLFSAFFSKYYTAAPVKLAYRGLGEFFVWFAFGPMAILVAAVSQNVGFKPLIIAAMPITGISTLSILLIGQMIDLDADKATGKWGIAARISNKAAAILYCIVQTILFLNVIVVAWYYMGNGWALLLSLIPYILLAPRIFMIVLKEHDNAELLKKAAGMNVQLHLLFSVLCIVGMIVTLLVN